MKLAEALILRADCQKRIAQLKSRLLTNAKVQEGDEPAETPQDLIAELERAASELLDLIKRINKTNSATVLAGRGTISDALAERDVLALQRTAYADLAQMGAIMQGRITRSEVKYVRTRDATLHDCAHLRQIGVSSALQRKYIALSQRIRDRSASGKNGRRVRFVDALDQIE